MRIEADSVLHHPRERVFAAYRDDIREVVDFLPNVRAIEVIERQDAGSTTRLHNIWRGGIQMPQKLSDALATNFFSWHDRATWDAEKWCCEWTIVPLAFEGAVTCDGRCDFVDIGGGKTRLEMTGELSIQLQRVKHVPAFLAGSLGRTTEAFLVRQITANLASVSDGLAAYLSGDTQV